MKRRLLNILSALSLVLCLACVGMWVRGGFWTDIVGKGYGGGNLWQFYSSGGILDIQMRGPETALPRSLPAPWTWEVLSRKEAGDPQPWRWERPSLRFDLLGNGDVEHWLRLPYWLLTLLAAALPGFWYWKRRRANRLLRRVGLCRVCGYDLRASPERCPECGTPIRLPRDIGTKPG